MNKTVTDPLLQTPKVQVYNNATISKIFNGSLVYQPDYNKVTKNLIDLQSYKEFLVQQYPHLEKSLRHTEEYFAKLENVFYHLIHCGEKPEDTLNKFMMILDNKISKVFEQFDKALMNQSTIDYGTNFENFTFSKFRQLIKDNILKVSDNLYNNFINQETPPNYDKTVIKYIEQIIRTWTFLKGDPALITQYCNLKYSTLLTKISEDAPILYSELVEINIDQIKYNVEDQHFEKTYPVFMHKKDLVAERFHDILKERDDFLPDIEPKTIIKSVMNREKRRAFKEIHDILLKHNNPITQDTHQKHSSLSTEIKSDATIESQQKVIVDELNKIKKEFLELKSSEVYIDIATNRLTLQNIKDANVHFGNIDFFLQLENFMAKAYELLDQIQKCLKGIVDFKNNQDVNNQEKLMNMFKKAIMEFETRENKSAHQHGQMKQLIDQEFQFLNSSIDEKKLAQAKDEEDLKKKISSKNSNNIYLQNVLLSLTHDEKEKQRIELDLKRKQKERAEALGQQMKNVILDDKKYDVVKPLAPSNNPMNIAGQSKNIIDLQKLNENKQDYENKLLIKTQKNNQNPDKGNQNNYNKQKNQEQDEEHKRKLQEEAELQQRIDQMKKQLEEEEKKKRKVEDETKRQNDLLEFQKKKIQEKEILNNNSNNFEDSGKDFLDAVTNDKFKPKLKPMQETKKPGKQEAPNPFYPTTSVIQKKDIDAFSDFDNKIESEESIQELDDVKQDPQDVLIQSMRQSSMMRKSNYAYHSEDFDILKFTNDYVKKTKLGKINVDLEILDQDEVMQTLFEEFLQDQMIIIQTYDDGDRLIEKTMEVLQQDDPEQIQNILQDYQDELKQTFEQKQNTPIEQFPPQRSNIFIPFRENDFGIMFIEKNPSKGQINIFYKSDPPEEEEQQILLEHLLNNFQNCYSCFDFEQVQDEEGNVYEQPGEPYEKVSIMMEDKTLKFIESLINQLNSLPHNKKNKQNQKTYENLKYMLFLFCFVYEKDQDQFNAPNIHIDNSTVERIFYVYKATTRLYEIMHEDPEKLNEFFSKKYQAFSKDKEFGLHTIQCSGHEEKFEVQLVQDIQKIGQALQKDKNKKTMLIQITIEVQSEEQFEQSSEEPTGIILYAYAYATRTTNNKFEYGLYFVQLKQSDPNYPNSVQIQQMVMRSFQSLKSADFNIQEPVFGVPRHYMLYFDDFNKYTLPLWAHLIQKQKIQPMQGLYIMNFSLIPYFTFSQNEED